MRDQWRVEPAYDNHLILEDYYSILVGIDQFSVVPGQNYEFDQSDYQVFGWINSEESTQQANVAWNSDGTMIAVSLPDGLEIHYLKGDGTPLISLPEYEIVDLEWSGDDRFIAAGSEDGTIRIWGVPTSE